MKNPRRLVYIDDSNEGLSSRNLVGKNITVCSDFRKFQKDLSSADVESAFIVTENREKYHGILVSNNIIDSRNKTPEKIIGEISWIMRDRKDERIFFTSDTHFSHCNIIKYCNRPWNSGIGEDGNMIILESDIERMNADLIDNWNSVVGKDDIVYHLGDFALGDRSRIPEIRSSLNGKIRLILGNHDWFNYKKNKYSNVVDFFYKAGFDMVYDNPIIIDGFWILSHEPVPWVKSGSVYANLFGHVHNQEMYRNVTSNTYNCCVDVNGYKPILFSDIKERMSECQDM